MGTRLEGKTALVTGATSNIGRAIAIAFGAEGAHVVVSGRSVERGAEVVDRIIAGGGRAEFVAADLDGSPMASRELATEATRVLGGRIDILVNNAGIFPALDHCDHRRGDLRRGLRGQRQGAVLSDRRHRSGHGRAPVVARSSTWARGSPASASRARSTAPPRAQSRP